ncbi:MAG: SGNH/GDSL hydrolase family protein, partial [Clostridia bacterium]|nr:SGNH/GDSL hydrolase family protein [Clostridia bacterium]
MDDYFFKDFYDRFSGKNAQTVGISSTTVTDWIFYAQELIVSANPNAIVLHVGTNDIFDDKRTNVTENANNLITLFEIIHAKLPNTHIYWWTIEERINQSSYSSIVQGVNIAVKNYASTHTSFLTVVDTYSLMDVNDKSMWRENDTVHPSNPHGYDVFMQATVNAGLDSSYAPNVSFDIENVPLLYPGYYVDFNPELPGSVTYSVNKTGLTITDGKIIALETATAGDYTVTAKVGSFSDTFTVTVKDTTTIYTNSDGGKGSLYGKQDNGDEFIEGNNRFGSLINRVSANLGNDLTLFAGDSFMDERWFFRDFYNRFLGKNAQTVGISSSRAEQWIWYMQKLIVPANPKNLVMHIGTNDIFDGKQTAGTVTGYLTEMFDLLHQRLPNTTIYWWTIEERIGQSASSSKVTTLNANIVNYANGKNWLKIVDTYSILDVNDYSLWNPKESTSTGVDNVHPSNPKGYDLFMQATVNAGLNIADNALEILNTEGNQFRKYSLNYANNFVFKTTATVSNYYNNGHLSFNLNNSDSTRFLIWDNDSNGTFKYTIYNISANDVYDFSQTDKTIEIAILLTAKNAYMFVDGKLRCAYLYVNDGSLTSNFSFGSQGVDVKFENLIVDGTSSDAYKELLSNAQVSYYENLNKTTETKISDLAIVSATGTTLNDKTVVNDTDNYGNATATGYTKNFIFESKYTLTQAGSNAHITLHFDYQSGTNPTTRFLIMNTDSDADFEFTTNNWDGAGKGTTGLPLAVNGTIKFQVVVTDGNAYLFADGVLKCAYLNIEIKNFYYGAENMSGVFTETKVYAYGSAGTSAFSEAIKDYEAINSTATSEFT